MKKVALFAFNGDPLCFVHVLLNALDMNTRGMTVGIVLEGTSVKLGAFDDVVAQDLPLLADMSGHAGVASFLNDGFEIITF